MELEGGHSKASTQQISHVSSAQSNYLLKPQRARLVPPEQIALPLNPEIPDKVRPVARPSPRLSDLRRPDAGPLFPSAQSLLHRGQWLRHLPLPKFRAETVNPVRIAAALIQLSLPARKARSEGGRFAVIGH